MKKKTEKSAVDKGYYRRPKTTRHLRDAAASFVERQDDPDAAIPLRGKQRYLPTARDDLAPDRSKSQWLKAMKRMVKRGDDSDYIVRRIVQKWGVPHDHVREVVVNYMRHVESERVRKNPLSAESQQIVDGYNKAYRLRTAANQPDCPPERARELRAEAERVDAETRALDSRRHRRDYALSGQMLREAENLLHEADQLDRESLNAGPYGMNRALQAQADALRKHASALVREYDELRQRRNPGGLAHVLPGQLCHELRRRGHHGDVFGVVDTMDGQVPVTACWIEDLHSNQVRRVNATLLTRADFVEVRVGPLQPRAAASSKVRRNPSAPRDDGSARTMHSGMLRWNASVDGLSPRERDDYVIETEDGHTIDLTPSTFTAIQYDPTKDQVRATITTSEGGKSAQIQVSGGRLTFLWPPGEEFRNTRVDSFRELCRALEPELGVQ